MRIDSRLNVLISVVLFFSATIISVFVAYNTNHPGYENLFLLPLIYGVVYVLFISPTRQKLNNIYIHVFIAVSFTRYAILPLCISISGFYGGRSSIPPIARSYEKAIYLMSYEIIVVSVFTFFLFRKYKARNRQINESIHLPENYFIYLSFIFISILLGLIFPEALGNFTFLRMSDDYLGFGKSSLLINLITYILVISKYLVYILILSFCYRKYQSDKKVIYVLISFAATLLNISILFGANRADFIITAIVSVLLFYKLYPRFIKQSFIPLILIIVLITTFINEHRNHASLTSGENKLVDFTNTLQIYLAGPYNVAISLEATQYNESERILLHLGHELLRPVIGLNQLLKNIDIKSTSNYFNERIFFSDHVSQIVPMVGQGYFYFGFLLSPIIALLYIYIVKKCISIRDKQNRIELLFFLSIPIARIGFATVQNGSILANDLSFFLVLFVLIYYFNSKIYVKR